MKKLITNILLFLAIISIASAASVSTDSSNYDAGDAVQVTVSDCSAGSTVTLNVQGFWSDQGVSDSSNQYTSIYSIPSSFMPGTYTLNANCASAPITTNFCINPGCSTGESSNGDSGNEGSSGGSGSLVVVDSAGGSSGGSSSAGGSNQAADNTPTQDASDSNQDDNGDQEEGSSILIILLILALLAVGGYFLWKKYKKPTSYAPMPKTPSQ
jgi:hypothetical protein